MTDRRFARISRALANDLYFRDPNGYVIELTAKMPNHAVAVDPGVNGAREKLARWQATKPSPAVR